jgi:hypothetical protein
MPGPKMGPRPADFNESVVRQSPTYQKWLTMSPGERLRYACRDFVKGQGDDEERLMRRIMIARRNNLRDHDTLKRVRAIVCNSSPQNQEVWPFNATSCDPPDACEMTATSQLHLPQPKVTKRRKATHATPIIDDQVAFEMDVEAVEATRSYRMWQALEDGQEFVYNQKYIKGKPSHDWLLRKNIWRRMRYRRENKKMVQAIMQSTSVPLSLYHETSSYEASETAALLMGSNMDAATELVVSGQMHHNDPNTTTMIDDALLASAAAAVDKVQHIHKSVVDAAVAAAESYVKSNVDSQVGKGAQYEL